MENNYKDVQALKSLELALRKIKLAKLGDRSPKDRQYSIVITELQKNLAYFKAFIVDGYDPR